MNTQTEPHDAKRQASDTLYEEVDQSMRSAVFLDRDGVINHLCTYSEGMGAPRKRKDVRLIDGARESILTLRRLQIPVFVASNQPDYALGRMTIKDLAEVSAELYRLIVSEQIKVPFTELYYCTHHPEAVREHLRECGCRKPLPGLYLQAAVNWNIDLASSVAVGDQDKDTEAALRAGVGHVFQLGKENNPTSLAGAMPIILRILGC